MAERSIPDMTISTLLAEAQELQGDVVRLRRTIHRQPELGLQLPRTQNGRVYAWVPGTLLSSLAPGATVPPHPFPPP